MIFSNSFTIHFVIKRQYEHKNIYNLSKTFRKNLAVNNILYYIKNILCGRMLFIL